MDWLKFQNFFDIFPLKSAMLKFCQVDFDPGKLIFGLLARTDELR